MSMKLLKFELYKIFKQKAIWVTFIVLIVMSCLSLNYPYDTELEKAIYKDWEGPITEEKIEQAKTEYAELRERLEARTDDEEEIFSESEEIKIWIYQKVIMSEDIHKNVAEEPHEIYLTHHTGPAQIVGFVEFGSFLVLGAMLLIGLSSIYSREYSLGIDNYIFSTAKGRKALIWSKIGASLIYTLVVVAAWEAVSLSFNLLTHGNQGWGTPLQLYTLYTKGPFVDSPYVFSLLEFHFVQLGIHLAGALGFALLIVLISSISKSSLISFFTGASIYIAPEFLGSVEWLRTALNFSFLSIVRVQFLFTEYKALHIFGYPIIYPVFAVILMIVLSLIFVRVIFQVMKHKEVSV